MNIKKADLDLDFVRKWMKKGLHPILLSVLSRRGLNDEDHLASFLLPVFENISSPFLFSSAVSAYQRIAEAVEKGERVLIFGDRDVDGITSISIMYDFLHNLGAQVSWDLPVKDEPFGLSMKKVSTWKDTYDLVITVDCGITNTEEISFLKSGGIDTIIVDHHTPPGELPGALAIINPKCEQAIEFDDISACFVCFIFILGYYLYTSHIYNKKIYLAYPAADAWRVDEFENLILTKGFHIKKDTPIRIPAEDVLYLFNPGNTGATPALPGEIVIDETVHVEHLAPLESEYSRFFETGSYMSHCALFAYLFRSVGYIETIKKKYIPYTALSTLSDIMPLKGSNRSIVKLGLDYIRKGLNKKILALCSRLKLDHEVITSTDLAWKIIPVLNAPGRMGNARISVQFLLQDNYTDFIETIIGLNEKRKQEGFDAFNSFAPHIETNRAEFGGNLLFFSTDEINRGITGIIANKLSDRAGCPAIVATQEGDHYSGSIRGNSHYHFAEFLDKAKDILSEYGGHENAAGFRFPCENLESFTTFLKEKGTLLYTEYNDDSVSIDAEIPHQYLDYSLLSTLQPLEPYGELNENPVLYTSDITLARFFVIGKEKNHLKLFLQTKSGKQVTAMYWNIKDGVKKQLASKSVFDVIYTIELNNYGGKLYPNLNIIDIY